MTKRPSLPILRGLAATAAAQVKPVTRRISAHPWMRGPHRVWHRLLDEACDLIAPAFTRFAKPMRLVAVSREAGGVDLFAVVGESVTPVASPPADRTARIPVELRLRSDQMLERSLVLPAASRDYLDAIVDHRLERLVPWRREAILYGYTVEVGDGGTLTVRVLLTSAEIVAGPLAALQALGLTPARIGGEADRPGAPLRIPFGRGSAVQRPVWHGRFGRLWLAATTACCLLAVGATIFAIDADAHRAEADRHLVKARRLIREAAEANAPDALPILADKRPERATMVLIDRLAAALPDTSYLRELAVTPQDVRLVGSAADAPALIPVIEQAGFFNVRFTGPVSRGDDKRDTFEITADRVPKMPPQ